ncbi:hypothetical protein ABII15_10335 [Streptomyces sp. HUAS MG91]|uniref:DUF2336 domain-containing protein n=1 Tax=Streptomyces tabacisoli TaxID=3156398 RepID=A0AAU8IQ50_9ACTN
MNGSEALQCRAEVLKIERVLAVAPGTLSFLDGRSAADLRRFREQAVAALFDRAPDMIDRIAAATRLVPATVSAAIAQKALGPRLAGAVAGRMEPARAAAVIDRLPVAFTAEACAHLDPRRIPGIVDRLDEDLLVRIAVALAGRGDHLTMGRFVGHVRDSALLRIIPRVDDAAVLRTGFLIDRRDRLGRVVELMGQERLARVVAAASGAGLWPETLAVAGMVTGERRTQIAELTADRPRAELASLVSTVAAEGLWAELLPLVALLDDDRLRTVAALPALRDPELLADVVRAVVASGLWGAFLPLADALPTASRTVIAATAAGLPEADLTELLLDVERRNLWELVLPLIETMPESGKARVFTLPAFRPTGRAEGLTG